ncbi:hypothetical protein LIER_41030 [Lithospermum erythrorhizon]|uniref:Uncharacterized protein n=1 Tax=Lithospermum erythrorhizon TaxID=34254 RepID=A0AAV3R7H6_LITER
MPILKLAVPSCISVCLEWWWYELILLAGLIPYRATKAVGTMGILVQATTLVYMGIPVQATALVYLFPSSLSMALSGYVNSGTACRRLWGVERQLKADFGRQDKSGIFYFVGPPVAIVLCFVMEVVFLGFWYGLLAAQIVCAVLMIGTLVNTEWEVEGERARELLGVEDEDNEVLQET